MLWKQKNIEGVGELENSFEKKISPLWRQNLLNGFLTRLMRKDLKRWCQKNLRKRTLSGQKKILGPHPLDEGSSI